MRFLTGVLCLAWLAGCASGSLGESGSLVERPVSSPVEAVVMVDAGSSGTRFHLYLDRNAGRGAEAFLDGDKTPVVFKFGEGVSSFQDRPQEAGDALIPSLEEVVGALRSVGADPGETPVYVFATAGMRLVPEEKRASVFADIREAIEGVGLKARELRVISGEEEAAFAWLTVNRLRGTLDAGAETTGVMDLGGASTQIAFEGAGDCGACAVLRLGGEERRLFVRSYLGFGQDEAQKALSYPTSCYPAGVCFGEDEASCREAEERVRDRQVPGDLASCRQEIERGLGMACGSVPCMEGMEEVPVGMPFVAVSSYFYTSSFFGVDDPLVVSLLEERAGAFCRDPWSDAREKYKSVTRAKYFSRYCFSAAYIASLLTRGYGFSGESVQIEAPSEIGGQELGWTYGATLFVRGGGELLRVVR